MADKKIIAVCGATGAQGGGLARAILGDPNGGFTARAITRKPDSEPARALASRGAEVVAADINDVASLVRAFDGAWGAFCITNYWEIMDAGKETQQGRNLAEAAKQAGVRHAIWSTFEDPRERVPLSDPRMPTLMGRYKVPHFEGKAEADARFTELGVPTTFLLTSFYWENLIYFGMGPKKGPDGVLAFTLPMGDRKLPGIATEDIGKCTYGIFKRSGEFIGRRLGIAGEHLTGNAMAESLSRALGRDVRYNAVSPDTYRSFGFPGADDLGNMFQYKRDFETEFCGVRDLAMSRALNPELQTFDAWLSQNRERIPVE